MIPHGTTTFTWTVLGFGIATTALPPATRGSPYRPFALAVGGAGFSTRPYATTFRWSATGLPTGLTLSPDGVLSGTPGYASPASAAVAFRVTETVTTVTAAGRSKTRSTARATISLAVA